MADAIMGNTELGSSKQDLIAALVQKELAHKAILGGFFTNVSSYAVAGSKTISFPKLSSFTVANRSEGVKGDATALTASLDTMLLDQNAYVSWIIDAMTLAQANIPAQLESAKRAASAQARYFEQALISKLASVCSNFQNVGADVDLTYANTTGMALKIEEAHQNLMDCVWVISPKQKSVAIGLDEFKRADIYGEGNIPKGTIGFIHGAPVIVHSGLAQKQAFLAHKEAIAYGFQKLPQYGEQDAIEYGVGAKRAAVDQLFGVMGLQLGMLGASAGKSPLVVGLND